MAVKLDEMATSGTDIDRVWVDRRATAAAVGGISGRPAVRDRVRNRDGTFPRATHHGRTVPRFGSIVDGQFAQSATINRAGASEHR
jgi:hypothetical protein